MVYLKKFPKNFILNLLSKIISVLKNSLSLTLLTVYFLFTSPTPVNAEEFVDTSSLNSFGLPGYIDLPMAQNLPDGQYSMSSSAFGGTIRVNLSFQISENITGAFRYSRIPAARGGHRGYYWDRSFDVHYLIFNEKNIFPSIAIG